MRPMSWYCGSQDTTTVSQPAPNSWTMHERLWARLACVIITPLGSDVLPDVYCRKQTPSGLAGAAAAKGGGACLSAARTVASTSTSTQASSGHAASLENMFFKALNFFAAL